MNDSERRRPATEAAAGKLTWVTPTARKLSAEEVERLRDVLPKPQGKLPWEPPVLREYSLEEAERIRPRVMAELRKQAAEARK